MVAVASGRGPMRRNFGVVECFGHCGLDTVEHRCCVVLCGCEVGELVRASAELEQ